MNCSSFRSGIADGTFAPAGAVQDFVCHNSINLSLLTERKPLVFVAATNPGQHQQCRQSAGNINQAVVDGRCTRRNETLANLIEQRVTDYKSKCHPKPPRPQPLLR